RKGRSALSEANGLRRPRLHDDAALLRRTIVDANRDDVLAVGQRHPALVEAFGVEPLATVEVDGCAVGHAAQLDEAVARAARIGVRRVVVLLVLAARRGGAGLPL